MLTGTTVPGLVGHWNFDEGPDWHDSAYQALSAALVAHDSVGTRPAALRNMDGHAWVSGQQFTALRFDGVDDFLSVTGDLASNLGRSSSLAFWLKTTQAGAANPANSPAVVGNDALQFGGLDHTGRIGVAIGNVWVARSSAPINDGVWHFVALTRNAITGEVQVFVDGQRSASGLGAAGTLNTSITSIGRRDRSTAPPRYFAGRLDQVSLFDQLLDRNTIRQLQDNYGPKTWTTTTAGVTGQTFSTASVLFNAFDPEDDPLRVVSFTSANHGVVADNLDGTFRYTSAAGFVGMDQFEVTLEDGRGGFSRATMSLEVLPTPNGSAPLFTTRFENFAALPAGGNLISYGSSWRVPRTTDWEGDGQTDLLVGAEGFVWRYHNRGTTQTPEFDAGVKVQAAGTDISTGSSTISIALADLTGDAVADLVVSDSKNRLLVYRNTASSGQVPVYAAPFFLQATTGGHFLLSNARFDLGDWNNDGLQDVIVGAFAGEVHVFLNTGTLAAARMSSTAVTIYDESYNFFPRLIDVSRNGVPDLVRGINWGDVRFWLDPIRSSGDLNVATTGVLTILAADGTSPDLHALTDGPVVDFADFNGDGVLDLVIGGQLAGANVFLAFGRATSLAEHLADLEAIYDAHPTDLGSALEANGQQLLIRVRNATQGIIDLMSNASLPDRQAMFIAFATHVSRYSFLRLHELDTAVFHHVPSLVAQDILLAGQMLPDTPTHRLAVANLFEMTGLHRELYLEFRYLVGDNVRATTGQLESLQTFMRHHPRASYSDTLLTIDNFWGDGRGALIEVFTQAKNTFGNDTGLAYDEWAADIRDAILAVKPGNSTAGDYFTFVVGHEATHALDAYVRSRPNADLERRWAQFLVLASGPDVLPGSNGFPDLSATRQHFFQVGYWDGQDETWAQAWQDYWSTGPGAAIRNTNFLRGNVPFFVKAPQESLATQGNQHWVDSEGRILGALDRFRRGFLPNVTEALTFLDFLSVGMNRVPMFDIEANPTTQRADWSVSYADLERDDRGRITRVSMSNGREYRFAVNDLGVYTSADGPMKGPTSVSVSVSPSRVAEDGTANLDYTFTRTGATTNSLTLNFTVTGTATRTTDYALTGAARLRSTTGTLVIPAGQATKTITVNPNADTTIEANETVILTVTPTAAYLARIANSATGTIINDDVPRVTLAVSPTLVLENGTRNAIFKFTRTGPTTNPLTVDFTVGGSATLNTDYSISGATPLTGSTHHATFAAGQATKTVTVDPTGDTVFEANETVSLVLVANSGYVVRTSAAVTATIINDDQAVAVAVAPNGVTEDRVPNLIYTFTRIGSTSAALRVNFTVGGSASLGSDYAQTGAASFTATVGTVSFRAGQTTKTVTINPRADTIFELDEDVVLTVTPNATYSVGSSGSATGIITNDDRPVSIEDEGVAGLRAPAPLDIALAESNQLLASFSLDFNKVLDDLP